MSTVRESTTDEEILQQIYDRKHFYRCDYDESSGLPPIVFAQVCNLSFSTIFPEEIIILSVLQQREKMLEGK
jgi:hypothetical protein